MSEVSGRSAADILAEARVHQAAGRTVDATALYAALLADDPSNAAAARNLAAIYVANNDHRKAAKAYAAYVAAAPHDATGLALYGQILAALGQIDEAEAQFHKAAQLAPDDAGVHERFADVLAAQDRRIEAIAHYREAIRLRPSAARAHGRLGAILLAEGRSAEARASLETALRLDDRDSVVHNNLGSLALAEEDLDQALARYEAAADLRPDWALPRRNAGLALEALGRTDEALAAWRRVLKIAPDDAETLCLLGGLLDRLGRTEEAGDVLSRSKAAHPDHVETLVQLGVNLLRREGSQEALPMFKRADELRPDSPEILNNLACAYQNLRRHDEAIKATQKAVALRPDFAMAYNTMGASYTGLQEHDKALAAYRKAVDHDPDFLVARLNLAGACRHCGQFDAALAHLSAALRAAPDSADAHDGLGAYYRDLGDFALAEAAYRRALAIDSRRGGTLYNLGNLLVDAGRPDEAVELGRAAVEADPMFAPAHNAYALALRARKRFDEALKVLNRSIELQAGNPATLVLRADVYESTWRVEEALRDYEEVLAAAPKHHKARANVINAKMTLCDWRDYGAFTSALIAQVKADIGAGDRVYADIFNLQALAVGYDFVAAAARAKAGVISREIGQLKAATPFIHAARRRARIRIGYALGYTSFHSLPLVLKNVVERHDRDRFEVHGYSLNRDDGSAFSHAYRGAFDRFTDLTFQSPSKAAQQVFDDEIDILIDTTGHTTITCLPLMAFRPAPVQAHFLGYSVTTGAENVDYLITDAIYMPPHLARQCSEQVVYLPDTFMATTRAPISDQRVTRADCGLPDDGFVLCNFNHPCKFEPTMFGVWMRVLKQIPQAVLWLGDWVEATQAHLRREAASHGVDPGRLVFAEIADHPLHCARLALADLCVDNLYHGGGVTTVDALWSGVPVLTIMGDTPSSRTGATLLSAAGQAALITRTLEEYAARIVSFAADPESLRAVRDDLAAQRLTCPLFDAARYTRNLERAFELMWANYQDGRPPRPLTVAAS